MVDREHGIYNIDNIPAIARNIAYRDTVYARRDESDGALYFTGVKALGGYYTLVAAATPGEYAHLHASRWYELVELLQANASGWEKLNNCFQTFAIEYTCLRGLLPRIDSLLVTDWIAVEVKNADNVERKGGGSLD